MPILLQMASAQRGRLGVQVAVDIKLRIAQRGLVAHHIALGRLAVTQETAVLHHQIARIQIAVHLQRGIRHLQVTGYGDVFRRCILHIERGAAGQYHIDGAQRGVAVERGLAAQRQLLTQRQLAARVRQLTVAQGHVFGCHVALLGHRGVRQIGTIADGEGAVICAAVGERGELEGQVVGLHVAVHVHGGLGAFQITGKRDGARCCVLRVERGVTRDGQIGAGNGAGGGQGGVAAHGNLAAHAQPCGTAALGELTAAHDEIGAGERAAQREGRSAEVGAVLHGDIHGGRAVVAHGGVLEREVIQLQRAEHGDLGAGGFQIAGKRHRLGHAALGIELSIAGQGERLGIHGTGRREGSPAGNLNRAGPQGVIGLQHHPAAGDISTAGEVIGVLNRERAGTLLIELHGTGQLATALPGVVIAGAIVDGNGFR